MSTDSPFDPFHHYANAWAQMMSAMAPGAAPSDSSVGAPPQIARQMRSLMFATMARSAEQFMRSPQFLEGMKQMLDAAITSRQQMNNWLTTMQHSAQAVARQDVDSLMLAIRHIETRLLDSMTRLEARLDELEKRLGPDAPVPQPTEGQRSEP
jgi:hypothetical protein